MGRIGLNKIRIGTRKSPLAVWQAQRVRSLLLQVFPEMEIELVKLSSHGDETTRPFSELLKESGEAVGGEKSKGGGTSSQVGLFTRRLDEALLGDEADIAVHSLKDYPTQGS